VSEARTYLESNAVADTCSTLTALSNEVNAQTGNKISVQVADDILARVQRIKMLLGC
jgi:hypothetical protein